MCDDFTVEQVFCPGASVGGARVNDQYRVKEGQLVATKAMHPLFDDDDEEPSVPAKSSRWAAGSFDLVTHVCNSFKAFLASEEQFMWYGCQSLSEFF